MRSAKQKKASQYKQKQYRQVSARCGARGRRSAKASSAGYGETRSAMQNNDDRRSCRARDHVKKGHVCSFGTPGVLSAGLNARRPRTNENTTCFGGRVPYSARRRRFGESPPSYRGSVLRAAGLSAPPKGPPR